MPIHVSAVQLAFAFASSPQGFFDRVQQPIERAVQWGAQLVVLPNYTGLMMLGIPVPITQETLSLGQIARTGGYSSSEAMLRGIGVGLRDFYMDLFSSLAKRLQVYLAPGTIVESDGAALYNTAFLFAPDGKAIGSQRQLHRTPQEMAWGWHQGDSLRVFDVGDVRVGLVVGTDVGYPEVSRILALQGANVLVHPAAMTTWNDEYYLFDLWREAQSNQVFGVQACMVTRPSRDRQTSWGDTREIGMVRTSDTFRGKSAVYVPVELTENRHGILAQATRINAEEIVAAKLDVDALRKAANQFPIFRFLNYDLYTREFPGVYGEMRKPALDAPEHMP